MPKESLHRRNIETDNPMTAEEIDNLRTALSSKKETLEQAIKKSRHKTAFLLVASLCAAVAGIVAQESALYIVAFFCAVGTCGVSLKNQLTANEIKSLEKQIGRLQPASVGVIEIIVKACEENEAPRSYVKKIRNRTPTKHEAFEIILWGIEKNRREKEKQKERAYEALLHRLSMLCESR